MLENRCDSKDSVLSNIGMAMFETLASRGKEGFNEFGLSKFGQKSQCVSSDIFVRMLKVISNAIAKRGQNLDLKQWYVVFSLTKPESSPASASHWDPTSDRSRSRNITVSSVPCASRASQIE